MCQASLHGVYTIRRMGEAMASTVSAGKTSSFEDYEPHANAQGADDPSAEVSSAEDLPESGASGLKESVTDLNFGDRYFSKNDLTKGYHQIRVRPALWWSVG